MDRHIGRQHFRQTIRVRVVKPRWMIQARHELEPRQPLPAQNSRQPSPRRRLAGRRALAVARQHIDNESPLRAVVREVEVLTHPVPRAGAVTATRLELECGHLVPMPGGALVERTPVGNLRRCRVCRTGRGDTVGDRV